MSKYIRKKLKKQPFKMQNRHWNLYVQYEKMYAHFEI